MELRTVPQGTSSVKRAADAQVAPAATPNPNGKLEGYARDVMPSRVEADEAAGNTVPIADASGRQEGRPTPAERSYNATYEAVSVEEAQRRMTDRRVGKMSEIQGGLTDPDVKPPVTESQDFDPLSGQQGDPTAQAAALSTLLLQLTKVPTADVAPDAAQLASLSSILQQHLPAANVPTEAKVRQIVPAPPVGSEYLQHRARISLGVESGVMAMEAIDVLQTEYSVTILLPLASGNSIFIPKPGADVTVRTDERSWDCLFPGTYFEAPELQLVGLVFVKKDESDGQGH